MKPHAIDRDFAEKSRVARGWKSFRAWNEANKQGQKEFRSRMYKKGEDRARLQSLIDTLERERKTLIAPYL